MIKKGFLFKQTMGHFCVDATCAAIVINGTQNIVESFFFFALYNFLAFCLQPFAGFVLDKSEKLQPKHYVLSSFVLLIFAFVPHLNILGKIVLVGLGNCLFHVGAGMSVLTSSKNKMAPLGIFVSSGAVGLFLGTFFASNYLFHSILFLSLVILMFLCLEMPSKIIIKTNKKISFWVIGLLCICIAIRSFMGFMPLTEFKKTPFILFVITLGVFMGKVFGGILCDRWAIKNVVLISTVFVMGLFMFSFYNPYLWTMVQIIVNLSMPITLYLMYKSMPKYPAFSFGLSASCLVIGFVIAFLLSNIDIPKTCFLILFMLNSIIILYTTRKIK